MALKFTEEQILGLIPAQALIDFDRAKEILEKVALAQEEQTRKEINEMLAPTGFSIGCVFDSTGVLEYMVCDRDGDVIDEEPLRYMMDEYMTPDEG